MVEQHGREAGFVLALRKPPLCRPPSLHPISQPVQWVWLKFHTTRKSVFITGRDGILGIGSFLLLFSIGHQKHVKCRRRERCCGTYRVWLWTDARLLCLVSFLLYANMVMPANQPKEIRIRHLQGKAEARQAWWRVKHMHLISLTGCSVFVTNPKTLLAFLSLASILTGLCKKIKQAQLSTSSKPVFLCFILACKICHGPFRIGGRSP